MLKINNIFLSIILFLSLLNITYSSLKFNVLGNRERCFTQELYIDGSLLVRYDLTGFEKVFQGNRAEELFKKIKIFIKDDKGNNIYETELKSRKDKFVIFIKKEGIYQICTRYFKNRGDRELPTSILMGLKIRNDYQYTKLDESLHKEDVDNFWRKIRDIKRDMRPSIEASKIELKEEDKTAKSMISSIQTYYILCCFQLVIVVVMTIYIIVTYQDFLKKKSII